MNKQNHDIITQRAPSHTARLNSISYPELLLFGVICCKPATSSYGSLAYIRNEALLGYFHLPDVNYIVDILAVILVSPSPSSSSSSFTLRCIVKAKK